MIPQRFRVRSLFPGDGPPISDAVVTIASGRIAEVDNEGSSRDVIDLGDVALIPGLVNAHTHLEFSDLSEPIEPRREFAAWIRQVIAVRRSRSWAVDEAVEQGLRQSAEAGVAAVGEIATSNWPREAPELVDSARNAQIELVVFREILGLREDMVDAQLDVSRAFLEPAANAGWTAGLSPHAPYSLHPNLFEGLVRQAAEFQVPLAMHLAESAAELELLDRQTGPLVELFRTMGLWGDEVFRRKTRPLDFLRRLADLPRVLIVHGNLLDDEEIAFVAEHPRMSVVYCPRTHAAMGHPPHPWLKMKNAGINVALGTDSRASNPDLSIWHELRFLHLRHPELPASELLRLATVNGAAALGLSRDGTIAPGQAAQLVLVELDALSAETPERTLFTGKPRKFSAPATGQP